MTLVPSPPDLEAIVEKLSKISERGAKIASGPMRWPNRLKPADGACWSEDLDSLAGTEIGAGLNEAQRMALRLQELRNLFSISYYSEQKLIRGLQAVRQRHAGTSIAAYLDVFIKEEKRHSFWFSSFCERYCGGLLKDELPSFIDDSGDRSARLVFLSMAFLVESVLDVYNRRLARDMKVLPIVKRINHLHAVEEARHMSFDRAALLNCVAELEDELGPVESEHELVRIAEFLSQIPDLMLKCFCSPQLYAAAGIDDPEEASRQAIASGPSKTVHKMALASTRKFFYSVSLLPEGI